LNPNEIEAMYNGGSGSTGLLFTAGAATDNGSLTASNVFATAVPDTIRLVALIEETESITTNDFTAYVSRNYGTNWYVCPLSAGGAYAATIDTWVGSTSSITNGPAGTNIMYRVNVLNNKSMRLHGLSGLWD